ncbi:hypothetical protein ACJJTC_007623 [Scirpophaga incertulas]
MQFLPLSRWTRDAYDVTVTVREQDGAAATRSARETYGDDAIGFVQVQRLGNICTVKAKIMPEHRIKSKAYCCTFTCDEKEETVLNVECHDCAAQKGGCKHSVAFLTWLHRRSEEPSPTEKKNATGPNQNWLL